MMKQLAMIMSLFAVLSSANSLSAGVAQGKLLKQASVTRSEAEHIALSQVQDGRIVAAELEKEHGRLIWSFDIARPNTKNITELQVDAKSGQIVSNKIETPKDQQKEAAEDRAKTQHGN